MGFLDGLDEEYAPGWKPNPGDIIDGIITDITAREGKFGRYPILTMRRIVNEELTPERVAIHCNAAALIGWCEEAQPAVGDRAAVRYDGQKKNDKGVEYSAYSKTLGRAATLEPKFRLNTAPAATASTTPGGGVTPPSSTVGATPAPAAPADDEPW